MAATARRIAALTENQKGHRTSPELSGFRPWGLGALRLPDATAGLQSLRIYKARGMIIRTMRLKVWRSWTIGL